MKPLVSIIMNCYNGEKYLEEALLSIKNQTYQNWELIFWDNNSIDNSKKIFENFKENRFKYFNSGKSSGLGEARLKAYNQCKGELIAFLDVDDLWDERKLEKQVPEFKNEKIGLVICNTLLFNNKEQSALMYQKKLPPIGNVYQELIRNYFVSLETLIIRKKFIDELEYSFDPKYDIIHDLDLVSRVSKISDLAYVSDTLAKWRIHEKGESWKNLEKTNFEKRVFIQNFKDDNNSILKMTKKNFLENLYKDEIKFLLFNGRKFDAIKLAIKNFQFSFNNFLILIFALIPFSKFFYKKISKFGKLYPKL